MRDMTFYAQPCAEKKVATSGDTSDFPSSYSSGYSGQESVPLTARTVLVTALVICCTVVLRVL